MNDRLHVTFSNGQSGYLTYEEVSKLNNPYLKPEDLTHKNMSEYKKELSSSTKENVIDFFKGLSRVYSGIFGISLTAIFAMPAVLFFAWLFGWLFRQVWEVFLIGWN